MFKMNQKVSHSYTLEENLIKMETLNNGLRESNKILCQSPIKLSYSLIYSKKFQEYQLMPHRHRNNSRML